MLIFWPIKHHMTVFRNLAFINILLTLMIKTPIFGRFPKFTAKHLRAL